MVEWSQLANMTYMDAGRLDSNGRCLVSAPVCRSLIRDADKNRLHIQHIKRDKGWPNIEKDMKGKHEKSTCGSKMSDTDASVAAKMSEYGSEF